jgi:flagellar basal-body rod protein FlgC
MESSKLFEISAAGMMVERTRVEVAAQNLASATTIQTPDGLSYQPQRVVARATAAPVVSFAEQVEQGLDVSAVGLPQVSVEGTGAAPRIVYDPGHPYADENGNIVYPGVDTATEMVTLMSALRSYEANVVAMNTSRSLALKTLDIGGGT